MCMIINSKISDHHSVVLLGSGQNKHCQRLSLRTGSFFFEKSNMTLEECLQFFY